MSFVAQAKSNPIKRKAFNEQLRYALYEQIKTGMEADALEWSKTAVEAYGGVGAKRRVLDEMRSAEATAVKRVKGVEEETAVNEDEVFVLEEEECAGGAGVPLGDEHVLLAAQVPLPVANDDAELEEMNVG